MSFVRSNTTFAFDLYSLLKAEGQNLFFSPHSVSAALAMTFAGARAQTAEEMARALRFDLPATELHAAFRQLDDRLQAVSTASGVELVTANALWPNERFSLRESYLSLVEDYYSGTVTPLDYSAPDAAAKTLNDWVQSKTRGKIRDLISPTELDTLTDLILANAIYFKGKWARRFKRFRTRAEPFHIREGKTTRVQMMRQTESFGYADTPDCQILQLPYLGGDLSMLVLLPRERFGLGALERQLTAERLEAWTRDLVWKDVEVYLPRFKLRWTGDLSAPLSTLGMQDAFSGEADFSGMVRGGRFLISQLMHQAFVEVDEKGTEAAAVTGAIMVGIGADDPIFRVDHPFLFLIRENRDGHILFLGRVVNPNA